MKRLILFLAILLYAGCSHSLEKYQSILDSIPAINADSIYSTTQLGVYSGTVDVQDVTKDESRVSVERVDIMAGYGIFSTRFTVEGYWRELPQ
jgi:uncharacterized lipoprotein YajG